MPNKNIIYKLELQNEQFKKAVQESVGQVESFQKNMLGMAKKIAAGFLSIVAAVDQIKKGLADLKQEAEGIAKVQAVLKATGGVAGVTASDIEKMTAEIQKTTVYAQDLAREAAALGLTFTNINSNIFPDFLRVVTDISTVTGQDLQSSIIQVGKALQSPADNMTNLVRIGVNFTKQQREMIKNLQESGRLFEAQALIMQELQREFGGAAQAVGQTWSGTLTRLKNAVADARKEIFRALGAGGSGFLGLINKIIDAQDIWKEKVQEFFYFITHNDAIASVKELALAFWELLKLSFSGYQQLNQVFKSFGGEEILQTALKGWRMFFVILTNGFKNVQILLKNLPEIIGNMFHNIAISIKQTFITARAEIEGIISLVKDYLATGNLQVAIGSYRAATRLGQAQVARLEQQKVGILPQDVSNAILKNFEEMQGKILRIQEGTQGAIDRNQMAIDIQQGFFSPGAVGAIVPKEVQETTIAAKKVVEEQAKQTQKINEIINKTNENLAKMIDTTTNYLRSAIDVIRDTGKSILEKIGILTSDFFRSFGGFLGLSSPAVSLLAGGIGVLTSLASGFSSGGTKTSVSANSNSKLEPSRNITKTGPEIVNYYNNISFNSAVLDKATMEAFVRNDLLPTLQTIQSRSV